MIDELTSDSHDVSISWRLRPISVNEASSRTALLFAHAPGKTIEVEGRARGPLCEYATTLAAKYPLRRGQTTDPRVTSYLVDIPESCLWEPPHPFRYSASWRCEGQDVEILFGLRTLSIHKNEIVLNGHPFRARGVALPAIDSDRLRLLHSLGCNFLICPQPELANLTDQLGPMILANLPGAIEEASRQLAAAGPLHPSIGIWRVSDSLSEDHLRQLRDIDKTTLFARALPEGMSDRSLDGADLLLVSLDETTLGAEVGPRVPWLVIVPAAHEISGFDESQWQKMATSMDQITRRRDNCLGWVITES